MPWLMALFIGRFSGTSEMDEAVSQGGAGALAGVGCGCGCVGVGVAGGGDSGGWSGFGGVVVVVVAGGVGGWAVVGVAGVVVVVSRAVVLDSGAWLVVVSTEPLVDKGSEVLSELEQPTKASTASASSTAAKDLKDLKLIN